MKRLREHIGARTGPVFITRFHNPVMINQVAVMFAKAGKEAGIPFKTTPHVLRTSMEKPILSLRLSPSECCVSIWFCLVKPNSIIQYLIDYN